MTAAKATPAHTPGPWHISQYGQVCAPGSDEAIRVWGGVSVPSGSHPAVDESKANAARIVACVNACEGLTESQLQLNADAIRSNIAKRAEDATERDALRAEVERLREALTHALHDAESRLYTLPLNAEPIERAIIEAQAKIYSVALGGQA